MYRLGLHGLSMDYMDPDVLCPQNPKRLINLNLSLSLSLSLHTWLATVNLITWARCPNYFGYTSGHCRRWCSRMQLKIMAGSLFAHCKITYFNSAVTEHWLVVSLGRVTIRKTLFTISYKKFSRINATKIKIDAVAVIQPFYKGMCSPLVFVVTSVTYRDEHMAAQADSSLSNRRASLSRSLATDVSVGSPIHAVLMRPTACVTIFHSLNNEITHVAADCILVGKQPILSIPEICQ